MKVINCFIFTMLITVFVEVKAASGYDPEFKRKLKLTLAYEKSIPKDSLSSKKLNVKIDEYKNVPALFINKKPVFPMQMMPCPWGPSKDIFWPCRDFAAAGINLYSDIIFTAFGGRGDDCADWWLGEGEYDFKQIDNNLKNIIRANPNALILVRIKLNPPKWWQKLYPGELSVYYKDGKYISTKRYASLASKIWEDCYERMLRDFVKHIESSDYANHVYGYSPGGGSASEWIWYGQNYGLIDYCDGAKKRFKGWVREKYNNDLSELRKSWSDNTVTFENVDIPSPAERTQSIDTIFIDPENLAR